MEMDWSIPPRYEFRSKPEQNFDPAWVNYFDMLQHLNKDRVQTLEIAKNPAYYEKNKVLGEDPSREKINTYLAIQALMTNPASLSMAEIPDWAKSSILDSIGMMEKMVTGNNDKLFKTGQSQGSLPRAIKFTYHGDWDQHLARWANWLMGDK